MRGFGAASLLALVACGPSGGPKGECKDSLIVGDLVITEVFADFKAASGGTGADERPVFGKSIGVLYGGDGAVRAEELVGNRVALGSIAAGGERHALDDG